VRQRQDFGRDPQGGDYDRWLLHIQIYTCLHLKMQTETSPVYTQLVAAIYVPRMMPVGTSTARHALRHQQNVTGSILPFASASVIFGYFWLLKPKSFEKAAISLSKNALSDGRKWISSHWPVCPLSETSAPCRMGAR
jgi:hypothetical protein